MIYLNSQITQKPKNFDPGDMGDAEIYLNSHFTPMYFFNNRDFQMMEPWSDKYVHVKTFKGEVFQFRLCYVTTRTARTKGMVLTSTLGDTYEFVNSQMSIEGMHRYAKRMFESKVPVKGSYSGYSCSGRWNLRQYEKLIPHLKEQNTYFSDEVLENIYEELKRRGDYE